MGITPDCGTATSHCSSRPAQHILLAAVSATQLAQEAPDRSGVFTSTLVEVLGKSGSDLTYSDLFVRCRAAVRTRAENQNPQFEAYDQLQRVERFPGPDGFAYRPPLQHLLRSGRVDSRMRRHPWRSHGSWRRSWRWRSTRKMTRRRIAGTATVLQVGAQKSEVKLGFPGDESVRYRAEITSLPVRAHAGSLQRRCGG